MCQAVDTRKQHNDEVSHQVSVPLTATSAVAIPRDERRVALVIGPVVGAILWLGLGQPAQNNFGVVMRSTDVNLVLTLELHGDMVRGPIHALLSAGTGTLIYWESSKIRSVNGG